MASSIMAAGATSLMSTAAVSFVNNGGDIGQTLNDLGDKDNVKGYLLSMATAGALHMMGDTLMIDGKKLNDITPKNSNFGTNFGKNLVNNVTSAVLNSAVTGTSLEDNVANALLNSLVDTASGQVAVAIGDMTVPSAPGQPPKLNAAGQTFLHAFVGCIAGAIKAGEQGCQSGAVGAVVGETAAQWLDPTGNRPRAETLDFVRIVSAFAGAVTGDGSAQSVNIAADAGVNAAANNWLSSAEAKRKSDLEYLQLTGKCDSACHAELKQLQALDESRNKKLKDCQGSVTPDCQKARQDVRNAAAEYIRLNAKDTGMNFTYTIEKQETLSLSQQTMGDYTVWNIVKGAAESTVDGIFGMAKAGYEGFKAVFGDEKAQEHVAQWPGAAWDFIKDPNNWPQLMGAMSPENREKLAKAYESGDGKTAAAIMGENYSNLPVGGGMGTLKKVTGSASKLDDAASLLQRTDVDKVVEVPAGSKGNWDPSINTGTTGNLAPKTAYMLDNGHTYVTDGSGRVKEVTGNLSPNKMDRNEYQQGCAGRSGCAGDDGGHLIASSLGGAGDRINIVPQAATLNRDDWRAMERKLAGYLKEGKSVSVKIDVGYPASGGVRPSEFTVAALINGERQEFKFKQ
jgi:filamentous hemagglutinin